MSTILPALLVYVPASGCADFDHGILRVYLAGEPYYYVGPIELNEDALGRLHWGPIDPHTTHLYRYLDNDRQAQARMGLDYGEDVAAGKVRAEEWNEGNKARTAEIERKDEERFEDFRDQLRRHVSEGLDAFVIDHFDGSETDAKAVMGQGGIGCTDADLSHLFPAIDKQARLLWERGMRAQWAKEAV